MRAAKKRGYSDVVQERTVEVLQRDVDRLWVVKKVKARLGALIEDSTASSSQLALAAAGQGP